MISFSPTDCTDYHRLIFHAGHSCNATDVGSPTSWLDLHRFYDKFVSTQIGHTLLYCHFYECLYIELSILFVLSPWQNISKLYSSPPPPPLNRGGAVTFVAQKGIPKRQKGIPCFIISCSPPQYRSALAATRMGNVPSFYIFSISESAF